MATFVINVGGVMATVTVEDQDTVVTGSIQQLIQALSDNKNDLPPSTITTDADTSSAIDVAIAPLSQATGAPT